MAKWYGKVGYVIPKLDENAQIWKNQEIERPYAGDILKNSRRWQPTENLHDDLRISNEISIIADSFANENFGTMRYVTYMGSKWSITNADIDYPRINLVLGGVYNGQ